MRYRVLGPLRVLHDGHDVTPTGEQQRRLLTALVLHAGVPVPADRLVEVLWPDRLPADHAAALQTHVFRLRRALPGGAVETTPGGYRLAAATEDIDAHRFGTLVHRAAASRAEDPEAALALLDEGLSWWRGEPYEELADTDEGRVESARLQELRASAREERLATMLQLDRAADVVADLLALTAEHPLRERPRALLMQALAATGRQAEASRVYDDLARVLAEELGLEPSAGIRRLHDEIVLGASPAPAPAVNAAPAPPVRRSAFPAVASSLVGRDELVAEVVSLLEHQRCLTLIGTGGVGKTRVAVEVARQVDGAGAAVWFCELALAEPATVAHVVADATGVEERAGTTLVQRIVDGLRTERGVLVLDNCEHVLESIAAVTDAVLQHCPNVRVLATTRERLAVPGEHLVAVAPFPISSEPTVDDDALQLFADRARAVHPGFALDGATLSSVASICRRLDGLPLAIELAAARLQGMELDEVASGLDQRFRLLTSGHRTTPRQRSLAAAVAWSYDLLDAGQQRALDGLGVFAGPFPAGAAAAVLDLDEPGTMTVLADLVERSLVQRTGDGRFALLETLKHFAVDRLVADGRLDEVRRRHAAWVRAEAALTARGLAEPGNQWLGRLDGSLAELRAAHRYLVDTADADSALRLVVDLEIYAFFRMRPEVVTWAEQAVALGRATSHPATADALGVAAMAAWKRGDVDGALRFAREGVALTTELGRPDSWSALEMVGAHGLVTGDLDSALHWFDRALATEGAQRSPVHRGLVAANRVLALAYAAAPGADDEAAALLASQPDGPTPVSAYAWYAAAEVVAVSDPNDSYRRAGRAAADAEATGAWFVTGVAGTLMASIDARLGRTEAAVAAYRWLLPWWRGAGEWSVLGTLLRSVAELLAGFGRHRAAAVVLGTVTTPGAGHEVFGTDALRLQTLAAQLEGRLGREAWEAATAEGRAINVDSAAALAAAELDQV